MDARARKHQPNFLQRRESLSTVFSAALMRHRMSAAPPRHQSDIHEHHSASALSRRPFAAGSLRLPCPHLSGAGFPDRLTDISATDNVHGRRCVFWLACASLLIPNKAKRESSLRFRCPQCRRRCGRAFLVRTNGLTPLRRLRRFFLGGTICTASLRFLACKLQRIG